jgi:TrmH family RNA methyltransferase
MRVETITSAQNPKIKNLLLLQEKSKARREQGLFVVEGARELSHCLSAGYTLRTLFVCPEIAGTPALDFGGSAENYFLCSSSKNQFSAEQHLPPAELSVISSEAEKSLVVELPEQLYRKVAYRESTEGILAEVEYKTLGLKDLQLPENPLIMVLESVEKPGNLGAVLRSADAAKADAVLICDPLTDLYNPNLIRASIGAIFTVPTVAVSSEEAISFLQARDIQILTAQLQDSSLYYDVDMKRGTALVMGTESTGLTPLWRKAATSHIRIPMLGRLDSLNVSVSAAILLFEAVRQRQG